MTTMKRFKSLAIFFMFSYLFLIISCSNTGNNLLVSNLTELNQAIKELKPGTTIVLKNGTWTDVQLEIETKGTNDKPIIIKAETPGKVIINGKSYLNIGGDYIYIQDLVFLNGYSPKGAIIQLKTSNDNVARFCKIQNCVIKDFSKPYRNQRDHWIEFWGQNNTLENCYISGKTTQGPTVRVFLKGNQNINTHHRITNNYFGERPRLGGPHGETIQIGSSGTSMTPALVKVANNWFEKCDGEVEVISNKSNGNKYLNNVFNQCEGSLVLRHGNYNKINGNIFIGDGKNPFYGGIRVINTGHWITNNYFYKLVGNEFRSALAVMNGVPKSPQNRYNQVTDVVVAYNTWYDCRSPWQFSVGANVDKAGVLPKSEIRSARPTRMVMANNLVYNTFEDSVPVVLYDKPGKIKFKDNFFYNNGKGISQSEYFKSLKCSVNQHGIFIVPDGKCKAKELYQGFDFDKITSDLSGKKRAKASNRVGALIAANQLPQKKLFGPKWFNEAEFFPVPESKTYVFTEGDTLAEMIKKMHSNDTILIQTNHLALSDSLVITKNIVLKGQKKNDVFPTIIFESNASNALFYFDKGNLTLVNLNLESNNKNTLFSAVLADKSARYNLWLENCKISNFDKILETSLSSFADTILFRNSTISNCNSGVYLFSPENKKGEYSCEYLAFDNCKFNSVKDNSITFIRQGYDESTIGGILKINACTFTNCGNNSNFLIRNRGIINLDITNSSFLNNKVKNIALIWQEKSNSESNNVLRNSGKFLYTHYLKQLLMY